MERTQHRLDMTKHEYIKMQEEFTKEWKIKEETLERDFEHKMRIVNEKREIEDNDLKHRFHLKREEIHEEKARREEIEKHRILKVLHELKETEKQRQDELHLERETRNKRHHALRKHEKDLLENADKE